MEPEEELAALEKRVETLRRELSEAARVVKKLMDELEGRLISKKKGEELIAAMDKRKRLEEELKQAEQSLQECRGKVLRLRRERELVEERKRKEEQEILKKIEEKKAEREDAARRIEDINGAIKLGRTGIEDNLKRIKELEEEFQKWEESQAFSKIFEILPFPPGYFVVEALRRHMKILEERRKVSGQVAQLRAEIRKIREGIADLQRLKTVIEEKLGKIDEGIRSFLQRLKK